jgi:alanine dehydrogenase
VLELVHHGHEVLVQKGAGLGAGLSDADYVAAGAKIIETAEEVFASADMIVKVKEPQAVSASAARRPDPLHLPAPGARSGADQGPDRLRRDLHRL